MPMAQDERVTLKRRVGADLALGRPQQNRVTAIAALPTCHRLSASRCRGSAPVPSLFTVRYRSPPGEPPAADGGQAG